MSTKNLGWLGIARLGLVQTSLGSIVVLTTSTINRVMIVELSFLAIIPGLLVAWHYALQVLRPRWGHGSDNGGNRTPWIIGGMAVLAFGGFLAAVSVWLAASYFWAGLALAAMFPTLMSTTADRVGVADVVDHGSAGILVPPGDEGALRRGIARLIASPADAEDLGRRARARALRYDGAALVNRYMALYDDLLR